MKIFKTSIDFKKQIAIGILFFSLIWILVLGLNPDKSYLIAVLYDKDVQTVGELVDGMVIEQAVKLDNPKYNKLEIPVATYQNKLKNGSLTVDLVNAKDGLTVEEKSWNASDIKDNTFLNLSIKGRVGEYIVKIKSEGFGYGNAPTLFKSSNAAIPYLLNGQKQDVAIALSAGILSEGYNLNAIFFFSCIALVAGCFYFFKYGKPVTRKISTCMMLIIFIVTGSLLLTAYQTTEQWDLQMLYRLFAYQPEEHSVNNLTVSDLQKKSEFNYGYRSDGSIRTIYKSIHLPDLNDEVILMTLNMENDARKQQYDFSLFSNKNSSYNNLQKVRKVFSGQAKMNIVIQEKMPISEIRLDAGYTEELVKIAKGTDFLKLKSIEVNDTQQIAQLQYQIKINLIKNCFFFLIAVIATVVLMRKIKVTNLWVMKRNNVSIVKTFVLVGAIFGIIFTFLLPIYQAPDEGTHLKMIGEELGYSTLVKTMSETTTNMDVHRISTLAGERVDLKAYYGGIKNKTEEKVIRDSFQISPYILRHLPQDIGIEAGLMLNLPAYWIFIFGRLSSLITYLVLGALALRLMPIKKALLMALMLCPMPIQQAASLSYDSLLISSSLLFVSYILYLKYRKIIITWSDLVVLCILLITICTIKLPYVLLAGLALMIPAEKMKISFSRIWRKQYIVIAGFPIFLTAILFSTKISYGKIVYAVLMTPLHSFRLLFNTFHTNYAFYATSMAGNFGWLDTPVSGWFVWFLFLYLILSATICANDVKEIEDNGAIWERKDIGIIWGTFILITALIVISMVTWSFRVNFIEMSNTISGISSQLSQIKIIDGIQGRYFLPIILLPLLPIRSRIGDNQFVLQLIRIICIALIIVYSAFTLLTRYWYN